MKEACGSCRFWWWHTDLPDQGKRGLCRRLPPAAAPCDAVGCGFWPTTDEFSWCGEYQRKPEPPRPISPLRRLRQSEYDNLPDFLKG